MGGSCRGDDIESETDLHGGLAVRLLEICVINIWLHTELTRVARVQGENLSSDRGRASHSEDRRSPSRNTRSLLVPWFVNRQISKSLGAEGWIGLRVKTRRKEIYFVLRRSWVRHSPFEPFCDS